MNNDFDSDANLILKWRIYMKELSLLVGMALIAVGSIANAKTTVITENFQIVDKTENTTGESKVAGSQILGDLTDYRVVSGERASGDIAFVKNDIGRNFVIRDSITIVCKKNINCVTEESDAIDLGHGFYKINVQDYKDWKSTMKKYRNNPNVKKVAPSYNFGAKAQLK